MPRKVVPVDVPEGCKPLRFVLGPSLFGVRIRLQRKTWFFWETLDVIIPVSSTGKTSQTELVDWGKALLLESHYQLIELEAEIAEIFKS